MTRTNGIVTQVEAHRDTGTIHHLHRRDLERRLDYSQRLTAHLVRLNRYLAARLAEVRYGR